MFFPNVVPVLPQNSCHILAYFDINNYGHNLNLFVNKTRHVNVPKRQLKHILFWNLDPTKQSFDANGKKIYSIGSGNEVFYENICPDTRLVHYIHR